jgi:hypothetical protein
MYHVPGLPFTRGNSRSFVFGLQHLQERFFLLYSALMRLEVKNSLSQKDQLNDGERISLYKVKQDENKHKKDIRNKDHPSLPKATTMQIQCRLMCQTSSRINYNPSALKTKTR